MRRSLVRGVQRAMLGVVLAGLLVMVGLWWSTAQAEPAPAWLRKLIGSSLPLDGRRVAIVAGHRGNDSGTICSDGLSEVSINEKVAGMVARTLRSRGATVDELAEFDPRLQDLGADAFVSIHSDSCQAPTGFSGYKVAARSQGAADSQRLTTCLWNSYAAATGLTPHYNTITDDMRQYHAFRLLAPATPGAIIELGFLNNDRTLLTRQPERAARGVSDGIACFLLPASVADDE